MGNDKIKEKEKTALKKKTNKKEPVKIEHLAGLIEAAVFLSDEPITLKQLGKLSGEWKKRVEEAVQLLREKYNTPNSGLKFTATAGGYRFETNPLFGPTLKQYFKSRESSSKLSRAAMESLAIIAYKQPVTVPEINDIRSVDSSGVIAGLLQKKLIKMLGRKEAVGKPLLYGTTNMFLARFGLHTIDELPAFDEFIDITGEDNNKLKFRKEFDDHLSSEAGEPDTGKKQPASQNK